MTTLYITHEQYREHRMPHYNHPEYPGRIEQVWQVLQDAGLDKRMATDLPVPATDEQILRVHTQSHLDTLTRISQQDELVMIDQDTYALPSSPQVARLGAGGVVSAVDAVMEGTAENALVAVRPPGHHATSKRAMGFCLLNNIAVGVRYAQAIYRARRVAIVDYDVHHGNGTQDIFYEDGTVLFISTHQYPYYPGTGALKDIGRGTGEGTTLNIPLRAGHGDSNYVKLFEQVVRPAIMRFQPDLILVSAGFDAHHVDPLASMQLSHTGYAMLIRQLIEMAQAVCGGKIIFVMEGGYDLPALAHGMRNIAHALLREDEISDYYGASQNREPEIEPFINELRMLHDLP
ncbi:MAG: histone deacetylase family protein [Anaerolineae bacterium]